MFLSQVVDNDIVKEFLYDELVTKINTIKVTSTF